MRTPPTPAEIKGKRNALGLSVKEFETAIGYNTDGRVGLALEVGRRGDRVFELTGPAQAALTYLTALNVAKEMLIAGDRNSALAVISEVLPVRLRT